MPTQIDALIPSRIPCEPYSFVLRTLHKWDPSVHLQVQYLEDFAQETRGRDSHASLSTKRKRQKPEPLALPSLTISQREWIPSPAFRRPTLPACAERRVLRLCLRLNFRLAPAAPPLALPKARLPACAFRLYPSARPVSEASRLASSAQIPGFLWLALPTLIGYSVLRPCAFDRLPASIVQ